MASTSALRNIFERDFDLLIEGRAFEDRVQGRYHKFDDEAERRVCEATADALSDAVAHLRELMVARDEMLDALVEWDRQTFEPRLTTATKRCSSRGGFRP